MINIRKGMTCYHCGNKEKEDSYTIHLGYMDVLLCKKCLFDLRESIDKVIKEMEAEE